MAKTAAQALANLRARQQQKTKEYKAVHGVYKRNKKQETQNHFTLTKKIFWELFKKHSPDNYKINQDNEEIIYTILRYFLNDENFNRAGKITNQASLDKGLLIHGNLGVGKSELFRILHETGKELVTKVNCKDIWFNCVSAVSFVDDFIESTKDDTSTFKLKNFHKGNLYIDDLGFEKKAFKTQDLFAELLFERYRNYIAEVNEKGKNRDFKIKTKTYITTNSKPSEISARYGDRIGDRLPEMFNIISWKGESFRE